MLTALIVAGIVGGQTLAVDGIDWGGQGAEYTSHLAVRWHEGKIERHARARFYGTIPFSDEERDLAKSPHPTQRSGGCGMVSAISLFADSVLLFEHGEVKVLSTDKDGTLVIGWEISPKEQICYWMLRSGEAKIDPAVAGTDEKAIISAREGKEKRLGLWRWLPDQTPP